MVLVGRGGEVPACETGEGDGVDEGGLDPGLFA